MHKQHVGFLCRGEDVKTSNSESPQTKKTKKPPSKLKRDNLRMQTFLEKKSKGINFIHGGTIIQSTSASITHSDGKVIMLSPRPMTAPAASPPSTCVPPPISYDEMYQRSKLRDRTIFKMVRLYLGYFEGTRDGELLNGESKVSYASMIKSEGLPLGCALLKMYKSHLRDQGIPEADVDRDLKKVAEDARETRRLRIETTLEKERRIYNRKW